MAPPGVLLRVVRRSPYGVASLYIAHALDVRCAFVVV